MKESSCPGGKCKLLCPPGCGAHHLIERKCSQKIIDAVRSNKSLVVQVSLNAQFLGSSEKAEDIKENLLRKLKLQFIDGVFVGRLKAQPIKCLTNQLFVEAIK